MWGVLLNCSPAYCTRFSINFASNKKKNVIKFASISFPTTSRTRNADWFQTPSSPASSLTSHTLLQTPHNHNCELGIALLQPAHTTLNNLFLFPDPLPSHSSLKNKKTVHKTLLHHFDTWCPVYLRLLLLVLSNCASCCCSNWFTVCTLMVCTYYLPKFTFYAMMIWWNQ